MWFMIGIFMAIFIVGQVSKAMAERNINKVQTKDCPPHRWEYDNTGFLICMECKCRPGYTGRGSGGYE